MNKKIKIFFITIVIVLIACIGLIVYHQWNNITAVIDSFRYSQEDVIKALDKNKESLQQFIDESEDIQVRDLTEEEEKLLSEGKLTEEEVVAILTGKGEATYKPESSDTPSSQTPEKQDDKPKPNTTVTPNNSKPNSNPKPNQNNTTTTPSAKPDNSQETYGEIVSEAIARLYVQKSIYLGKLDTIESQVRSEYIALVKGSNMTNEEKKEKKQNFLKKNLSIVAAWEEECDSVVEGIISEIEAALKAEKKDTAIASKLKEAYLNEKRLKKSYFINRYMD